VKDEMTSLMILFWICFGFTLCELVFWIIFCARRKMENTSKEHHEEHLGEE